ncbi:APC family permease [Acidobacteria bacterium AB60]|nr:APC family permease [Acidobacteria bacterium AB60]
MRLLPLVAATFFMVSGGPYAIEDILGGAGYARAIVILLALPLFWSLPTALMIGELASAIPCEGGFYVWVRRAMGPFWGFQEAWLSLAASIFDMAIYPAFVVSYLGKFDPALTAGWRGYAWSLGVVAVCCVWNLRGAPAVGDGSVGMSALLLAPFAVFVALGFLRGLSAHPAVQWSGPASRAALSTAVLVAMWNYMGWDNASTIAEEVHDPRRTYPRAMLFSTVLVATTYILPLAAMALAGLSVSSFETGDWTSAARDLGGPLLGMAVAAGGVITGAGMFNALVMSYSRLPMAMAEDGMLPPWIAKRNQRGVPWVSVMLCGLAWALALKLPFEKLISIDLVLYGSSLVLEFVALVVLRIREPQMSRPFRAGSLAMAIALGATPTALIGYALYVSRSDEVTLAGRPISALLFSLLIALGGPVLYALARRQAPRLPSAG